MLDQRRGEGRVPAAAVIGDLAGRRGKGDHRAGALRVDRRQPLHDQPATGTLRLGAPGEAFGQRVVAAGIDEDHRHAGTHLHRRDDLVQRKRLGGDIELVSSLASTPRRKFWPSICMPWPA